MTDSERQDLEQQRYENVKLTDEIRNLKRTIGAIVMAAGGEVRVSDRVCEIIPTITLETWRDPVDRSHVYRAVVGGVKP